LSAEAVRTRLVEHVSVVDEVMRSLLDEIAELVALTLGTVRDGGTLFFCGNGGSAADAQHLAAEYVVRFQRDRLPMRALSLTTDTSILTAAGNDYGFGGTFERQVQALVRPGDLLVMHSTSGESENLLRAASAAREAGASTAALLAAGGGRLADAVDLAIVLPTDSSARAQEVHLLIGHIVCDLVEQAFAEDESAVL